MAPVPQSERMNFRHSSTLLPSSACITKVTALAWSPNSRKLAAVTIARIVHLFDELGTLKEKFATKPADAKGSKLYIVIGMVFSPDSTKLAVAQSDDIIFIYKLGLDWGEKKSICNKFQQTIPINNVIWPHSSQMEILFGLSDGKVKAGQLRTNRTITLHTHGGCSPVISLACSPEGCTCLAGHLDGSIYRISLDKACGNLVAKFANHGSVPTLLGWGRNVILTAGSDSKVALYDFSGALMKVFDFMYDKGFNSVTTNSTGDVFLLASYNGFHILQNSHCDALWEDFGCYEVKNAYNLSVISWKPDGSQVAIGGLCGNVDLFDTFIKRQRYGEKFEFIYISKFQVILTQITPYTKMLLQSQFGWEILRINIYIDQFLVAYTEETLLLGNLESCKLSEISWHGSGNEKFFLDNSTLCGIHDKGELSLVEYGCNEILISVQTDYAQEALISIRLAKDFSSTKPTNNGNNRVAYLLDLQTMLVKDILRDEIIDTIGHSSDVVWLQLNHHADYLLFCDKARELYIFGLGENKCSRLLNICNYVQWVPETNVIIAQSQWTLYIWYSIHNLQHATKFSLKGDLEGVRRSQGHTEVLVCEGSSTVSYELDEALIEVGLSLERSDVDYAFSALEALDMTFETRFMWKQLGDISLKEAKLFYAQCSYACSGDVYRSHYLQKINKAMRAFSDDTVPKQREQCLVQARLQVISKKWKDVETTLLEHGYIEDAMKLYIDAFRWNDALRVAYTQQSEVHDRFSKAYLEWLMETGQFEDVGKQYVIAGDLKQAIFFLLLGNLPGHAADHAVKLFNESHKGVFMEKIIHILSNRGMTEKLGEVMERLDNYDAAQHAYKEVHSFHRAVQLAQIFSKQDVMKLEEEWGDYLVSQNEMEEAIPHYLESGSFRKYVQAAAAAHQWNKAIQITMQQKTEVIKPIYTTLAREFEKIKQLAKAEKMFINAELPNEAVIMYLKANKLEAAQKVASQFLSLDEADKIFFRQAKDFESSRRFKDAEKLYLELGQHDAAINMYKAQGMFDNVIQLVSQFRKDGLHETLLYLAEELERKGMLRDAEHHYLELENWKHVVKMYTASAMWEDAMRVARSWGDISAVNEVAYAWAIAVKGTREIETLIKLGFLDQAIDHAVSVGAFNDALQMCTEGSVEKLKEVQSKFAKFLECQGRVAEAEDIYIKAGKPVDAIKMYTAKNEWKDAVRVADLFHPSALTDILVSQAHFLAETNELKKAEALFIQAKRPDLIIHTYKTKNLWDDAIRVAQKLMPDALHEIQHEFTCFVQRNTGERPKEKECHGWKSNNVETLDSIMMDGMTAESKQDFQKAIDIYIMMDLKSLPDMEKLRMVWYRAIELAQEHAKNRIPEVVHAVANQLVKAGQYQEAAHLYLEKRHYEEAVEIFVFDGQWEKAREVAERSGQEKLTKYIEKQYTELLLKNGEAGMPVSMGGVHKTLNICSEKEDWDKVHELSISMGPRAQKECSAHHISHCLQNSQILEAISVVKRYGLPHTLEGCDLCHQLASQLLLSYGSGQISSVVIQDFRNFLHTYLQDGRGSISSEMKSVFEDLEAVLIPLTYIVLHSLYLQQGMKEFAAKVSVSLLRFIQSLLPDLAFFYAGVSCKEAGWYDKAFVFFNQYLDIAETIDDKETSIVLDHPTFNSSDIPQVLTIPKGHSINSDKQQEIQDWVIQYSVNRQEDKTSMIRECTNCQSSIFEASLCCPSCKALSKACCVTGYPLDEYGKTECPYCHMPANTSDWKSFLEVFHICPWCNMHMDGSHM